MIKVIIFDLSEVCFSSEEPPFLIDFAKKHNLDFTDFDNYYQELLYQAENGKITGKEVWRRVLEHFSVKADIDEIISEMINAKEPFQDTLNLVKKLRKHYKTAFFTNYNEDYWKLIEKSFDFPAYFDFGLVSYQIGARKPAVEGFEFILNKFGVRPDEAVFTDDTAKNLENPKKLGIHTIQFKDANQLVDELESSGVKIDG